MTCEAYVELPQGPSEVLAEFLVCQLGGFRLHLESSGICSSPDVQQALGERYARIGKPWTSGDMELLIGTHGLHENRQGCCALAAPPQRLALQQQRLRIHGG